MAKILFFNTDNECILLDRKVEDGMVKIGDKMFIVDTSYPLLLKTKLGYTPLYIVKWNQIKPAKNIHGIKLHETERVNPSFKREKDEITPALLRRLMGMQILGNMIPIRKKEISGLLMIILGLIAGILITFALIYFKLLPIG